MDRPSVLAVGATTFLLLLGSSALAGAGAVLPVSHVGGSAGFSASPLVSGRGAATAPTATAALDRTLTPLTSEPGGSVAPAVAAAAARMPGASIPGSWLEGLARGGGTIRPLSSLPNFQFLEHPLTNVSNLILPGYLSQPAPLGIGDFGLGAHPYAYNSPHILGSVSFLTPPNATDPGSTGVIEPGGQALGYVGSVDEFGIQLNTVLTNVSLPDNTLGEFWTQNVVNWNATGLHFVSDTFNFTDDFAYIFPGTIYSGCDNDTAGVQNILDLYGGVFQCVGDTIPLSPAAYPVTLQLYNNASVNGAGQDVLSYGYYLNEAGLGLTFTGITDQIVFNDHGDVPAAVGPAFSVSGFKSSGLGLPEDSELDLVGDIGGDNAVFSALNATLSLDYSNASVGGFQSVPSAYNFGTDTGETSTGIADYWTPAHVLEANQGPAMLYGLWNAEANVSVPVGHIHISGTITPSYGFVFVSNRAPLANPFALGSSGDNLSYLPATSTGTFSTDLPPTGGAWTDQYYVQAFAPGSAELNGTPITGSVTGYSLTLPSDPGSLNAPLYMFSPAEAAALALNVTGSAGPPYTFENLVISPNVSFNHLNDYLYPSFEIFSASGVGDVQTANLSQGPDSPGGYLYFTDQGPSRSVLVGTSEAYSLPANYTAHIELYYGSDDSATDQTFSGSGGEIVLWGDAASTVADVVATDGSGGVFVGDSSFTAITNVTASAFSAAVQELGSSHTVARGISASDYSVGVEMFSDRSDVYSWINVSEGSTALEAGEDVAVEFNTTAYYNLAGAEHLEVTHVRVSTLSIGVDAAVSSNVSASSVSAKDALIGVELIEVTDANVTAVDVSGGDIGVGAISVANTEISGAEVLNSDYGIITEYSRNCSVADNLLFRSSGVGVYAAGGSDNHVYGNAFLYNDGSGTTYSSLAPQAYGSSGNYFNSSTGEGNLWTDWHTYTAGHLAPYPVGPGIFDEHPETSVPVPISVVTFTEQGLPAALLAKHGWNVYFDGVAQAVKTVSMNFTFPFGTFSALSVGPNGWLGTPNPVAVTTEASTTSVTFHYAKGRTATLTFHEKGLPRGTQYCLELDGAPFCSVAGVVRVSGLGLGSYAYSVTSPLVHQVITATVDGAVIGGANGSVAVSKSTRVALQFAYYYSVYVVEFGLPSDAEWSMTVHGHTETVPAGGLIEFNLTNGTYRFTIRTTAPDYRAEPASGRLPIDGNGAFFYVLFFARDHGGVPTAPANALPTGSRTG